jgi:hypothetical protein
VKVSTLVTARINEAGERATGIGVAGVDGTAAEELDLEKGFLHPITPNAKLATIKP